MKFDDYMQIGVLAALISYLFVGALLFNDTDNTKLIVGAFIGYLGANSKGVK